MELGKDFSEGRAICSDFEFMLLIDHEPYIVPLQANMPNFRCDKLSTVAFFAPPSLFSWLPRSRFAGARRCGGVEQGRQFTNPLLESLDVVLIIVEHVVAFDHRLRLLRSTDAGSRSVTESATFLLALQIVERHN
jgi:hypothetical protein